ncbi:MAG TPA: MarR family transcriptional regulator [Methanoregula sp.]|nr:MarR family transcriptional regulator [Methanoregula sp.]
MKAEDVDWLVYHRIPENAVITEKELCKSCGLDAADLNRSLGRLERSCLVERSEGGIRMLNFGEALLRNQCKYEPGLPYTIENGIIKARKN